LNDGKDDPELSKSVLQFIQLETSAEDVRDVIHRLKQQLSATKSNLRGSSCKETQRIVLLHLGVWASGSTGFKLERCAWNDASFRIPDEQGYHPMKEKIVDDKDFGQCMTTSLDLQRLSAVMVQSYPKIKTSISTDPGRFVCNYIYCTSLDAFRDDDNITSLFLHVPPFNVVDELDQLAYVTGLIRAIVELPTWSIINVK
jgi:pyroglutamyl-peptidase